MWAPRPVAQVMNLCTAQIARALLAQGKADLEICPTGEAAPGEYKIRPYHIKPRPRAALRHLRT